MLQAKSVVERLVEFIAGSFLERDDQLTAHTPLLELNILDSASLFDVVDFVRSEWRIHIPASEIHPDNFASISRLDRLISNLLTLEGAK